MSLASVLTTVVLVLLVPTAALAQAPAPGAAARIAEINAGIAARGDHWTAGVNSLTGLTPEELQRRLGFVLPEEVARALGQ
jgi:hypothetical protein